MSDDLLKPAEAAAKLGMPPSTLRVYSTKFAELLSEAASNPPVSADGRTGHRVYSMRDLGILTKAKDVLARGLTYEQALVELRALFPVARTRGWTPVQGNGHSGGTSSSQLEGTLTQLLAGAQTLQRAAEMWQGLAVERGLENEDLRARLSALEAKMDHLEERWERLIGRIEEEAGRQPGLLGRLRGR